MEVIKSTGEKEPFNKEKFCNSIKMAGAPHEVAEKVCSLAAQKLAPGVTTTKIFRTALNYLIKENLSLAASYSLRRAVDDFGPDGFVFEKYVEIILQAYGYETARDVIINGICVSHEVDVLAKKDNTHYIIEAKYRNERGIKTHIDVVMYGDARLADITKYHQKNEINMKHELWVFTNTKFTDKSIQYANCRNIMLTGWNYPRERNLQNLILNKKLYPVTVLPSVNRFAREQFAQKGALLAQDLLPYSAQDLINEFKISLKDAQRIALEARQLAE